jgi:hypothetical protein
VNGVVWRLYFVQKGKGKTNKKKQKKRETEEEGSGWFLLFSCQDINLFIFPSSSAVYVNLVIFISCGAPENSFTVCLALKSQVLSLCSNKGRSRCRRIQQEKWRKWSLQKAKKEKGKISTKTNFSFFSLQDDLRGMDAEELLLV